MHLKKSLMRELLRYQRGLVLYKNRLFSLFSAPEVLKEEPYTEKSETYAFAVIMWELIARKHPYSEYRWMWEVKKLAVTF
jgi:hypothetical protein